MQMQIQVQDNSHTVVFMLNNSAAAESLYNQLPLPAHLHILNLGGMSSCIMAALGVIGDCMIWGELFQGEKTSKI